MEDSTSQSVAARNLIQRDFAGLGSSALQVVVVDHNAPLATDPAAKAVVARATAMLRADKRVSTVVAPQPGVSLSADGRTGIVTAGAAADPNAMVGRRASGGATPAPGNPVDHGHPDRRQRPVGQLQRANHAAMMRSELLSWPVTLAILVIAFGSLVAAGLPLMLTMAGLLVAAGALVLATKVAPGVDLGPQLRPRCSPWRLGIDYALFLVVRFRAALHRRGAAPGDRAARGRRGRRDRGHRRQGRGLLAP